MQLSSSNTGAESFNQDWRPSGASGAPNAEQSGMQPSTYGATFNARHHPPRRTAELKQVSRMKAALFAVGCMPLLGAA
jgi:hypothetical protein